MFKKLTKVSLVVLLIVVVFHKETREKVLKKIKELR